MLDFYEILRKGNNKTITMTSKQCIAHSDLRQSDIPPEREGDGTMGAIVAERGPGWRVGYVSLRRR